MKGYDRCDNCGRRRDMHRRLEDGKLSCLLRYDYPVFEPKKPKEKRNVQDQTSEE
jgi:hypothetical protein